MRRATGGIPRYRPWAGPAVLSAGFRPFFLLSGLSAAIAVPIWLAVLGGHAALPTAFDPVSWHAHEMLFGFAQAAMAGFLLTAVPNWTGRMPIQGWGLGALALLFVAGRVAVACSARLGPVAAAVDLVFPLALLAALAREVVAGRNWRNMPMLAALGAIAAANGLTHLEALGWAATGSLGMRLGVAVLVALIGLVGGRLIPSFTRNLLSKRGAPALPVPAGRLDAAVLALTAAALAAWTVAPEAAAVASLMGAAAVANLVRLARWQGLRTTAEPLVWALHVGFLWIPIGLGLIAIASVTSVVAPSAAIHALTGGAIAIMILAVSTRAVLSHTGRGLHAGTRTTVIYGLAAVSAVTRVAAGFTANAYWPLLLLAGSAWTAAFVLFLLVYGPMLLAPRAASAPG